MNCSFKKRLHQIVSWIPVLFYLANLYFLLGHSGIPFSMINFLGGLLGLFLMLKNNNKKCRFIIPLFLIYFLTLLFNLLTVGNLTLGEIRFAICSYGISVLLLYYPINFFQGVISFYLTAFFFFQQFINGADIKYVLSNVSSNYISVLLILSVSLYYIGLRNIRKKLSFIDLFPALICFLLSVWAFGRGGILSSLILFVLIVLLYFYQPRNSNYSKLYMHLIAIGLFVYVAWNIIPLIDDFMSLGKWKEGSDEARPEIWASYFKKTHESILYFITGAPLSEIPAIRVQNGNTHNSFIQLHAYNGIFFFCLFSFLIIKSLWHYLNHKEFLYLIVLLVVIFRGMTDMFIFGTYGMPIMCYLVLYPYIKKTLYKSNC